MGAESGIITMVIMFSYYFTVYSWSSVFPKTPLKAPLSSGKGCSSSKGCCSVSVFASMLLCVCVAVCLLLCCLSVYVAVYSLLYVCCCLLEFEGHYWAETKNRLKQRQKDNIKLVISCTGQRAPPVVSLAVFVVECLQS